MAAALLVDLRERVLAAVDAGEMVAKVARRFGVTRPTIYSWLALREETGSLSPRTRSEPVRKLDEYREQIEAALDKDSGLTLADLKEKLGLPVEVSAVRKALDLWDLMFKKSVHASEQLRPDVQKKRVNWVAWRGVIRRAKQRERLVFIDETSVTTSMLRLWGWGRRGERIVDHAPLASWKTCSLIGSIRTTGWSASMVVEGAVNAETFIAYTEQCLLPTLAAGDIVVLDNVPFPHDPRVETLIRSVGARVRFLPTYSPDFNPIEKAFSALKSHLRKLAQRTFETLVEAIGNIQNAVPTQMCRNLFEACLYL